MATPTLATVGGSEFSVGCPGLLASDPANAKIESRLNESATAQDYGDLVCRGVAVAPGVMGNCKPPVSGGVGIGIAVRALSEANTTTAAGTTAVVNYAQNKTVPILKDGDIWCIAAEAVTEGDDCLGIVGTTGIGSVQAGAANGTTRLALPGAKWQQTVGSGAVGLVRVKTTNL